MNATPDFIVVGRMLEPVQAGILHLPALEPMKLHVFLRGIRETWEAEGHSLNLVLFADRFLQARVSQLKILKKSISLSGFQVAGVMGDHEQMWAEALDVMVVSGKPRLHLDFPALRRRNEFLKNAYPLKESDQLEQLVEECLRKVDTVAAQLPAIPTIATYLAQAEQERTDASAEQAATQARPAEEQARLDEEARLAHEAEQARLAEEARVAQEAEEARVAQEAEQARLAEEARLAHEAEQARLAEEARAAQEAEEARVAQEAEQARLAEEARVAEERQVAAEIQKRLDQEAEQARIAEEARAAQEAEDARLAQKEEEQRADDARRVEEALALAQQLEHWINTSEVIEPVNEERQNVVVQPPLRVTGRIRSGQVLEHPGDIIVEGAVHPGGVVAAQGDIHVYGTAGGKLQAGVNGNQKACIYIQAFDAEIVEIAGKYRVFEDIEDRWVGRSVKVSLEEGVLIFEEMTPMNQRKVA